MGQWRGDSVHNNTRPPELIRMTGSCSMTAVKYLKDHRLTGELEPGQRVTLVRDMARNVKGFRQLHNDLSQARLELEHQRAARNSEFENSRTYQTHFYKSVVGTRTTKLSGGMFQSNPVARETFFSDVKSF